MRVDGGCHCGSITYEATIDPQRVTICHCEDCQNQSGSAFRVTTFVPQSNFRIVQGEPCIYRKTSAESGGESLHAFCRECGSNLFVRPLRDGPIYYGLQLGTIAQRRGLKPSKQVWRCSALDWLDRIPDLPVS
jgi:hypothetical protein